MKHRVTVTIEAPPGVALHADREQAADRLDAIVTWALRIAPGSLAVVDGRAGGSTITLTLDL